jgi:ribosomal protein L7/L12
MVDRRPVVRGRNLTRIIGKSRETREIVIEATIGDIGTIKDTKGTITNDATRIRTRITVIARGTVRGIETAIETETLIEKGIVIGTGTETETARGIGTETAIGIMATVIEGVRGEKAIASVTETEGTEMTDVEVRAAAAQKITVTKRMRKVVSVVPKTAVLQWIGRRAR